MTANRTIVFPRHVRQAVAVVRGYQVGFSGSDHHVGLLEVALDTAVDQNTVTVQGRLGCRDWSGTWDDDYGGTIQVSVIAELVSATEPPPRGDVVVVDVEVNQATQFFRSAEHLDAANVRPDNSIPLVAGKATGIRLYVDYDATSGLPPITQLSGELEVSSGGATTTLAPLTAITPRAVTEVDRGTVGHTLNFVIPGGWCDGVVDVTARVFDASAPGQRSGALHRTLRFVRVNPLRVYAVGINYTGANLDLPAPMLTDFVTTFDFTRRVWPTGDLLFSGYTTLAFSGDLSGTASEGCGDGFNDLQDDLKDIKGDTDDLVYGLLPNGTPLTGVGGCGGGGAGSGMIGAGATAAHEAGHAVGRDHAPCDDSARCDSPRNTDDDFPQYGSYVSDSIGEFGFDAENGVVRDPATSRDFMGYSGSDWISPYTYAALMAKGDPQPSTGGAALLMGSAGDGWRPRARTRERAEWIKRREPVLFLRVRVDGDDVEVLPSFTYPALRRPAGRTTSYEVHVVDEDGRTRACEPLRRGSGSCGCGCGPATLYAEVPVPDTPARLVVRRRGAELADVDVEDPVTVRCDADVTPEGDLRITWQTDAPEDDRVWFLVQWQDRDGTWRGLGPRTTETSCVVPRRMRWATKTGLRIRVLATRRLATSSCELEVGCEREDPPVDVVVYATPGAVGAVAVDPLGRKVPSQGMTWFDESGGELGRGDIMPRSALPRGVVRAVPTAVGVTRAEGLAVVEEAGVVVGAVPAPNAHEHDDDRDHQHGEEHGHGMEHGHRHGNEDEPSWRPGKPAEAEPVQVAQVEPAPGEQQAPPPAPQQQERPQGRQARPRQSRRKDATDAD